MVFHFPDNASFTCNSCGKCCSSGFEIPVEDEKVARITTTELHRGLVKEGYEPLPVLAESQVIGYSENGSCHYHQNQRCGLHSQYGLTHKPVVCQTYPFNLVSTPDGIYTSLLFSCPSVVSDGGRALEQHQDELEQLVRHHPGLPSLAVKEHVLVTQYSTMTWTQYINLEERLLPHLDNGDPVRFLLNLACLLVETEPETLDPKSTSPLLQETFEIALPMMVNIALGHVEFPGDPVSAQSFLEQLQSGIPVRSERLGAELAPFEPLRPEGKSEKEAIQRYLRHQFQGKLLAVGPSMISRLFLVACALSVLLYDLRIHGSLKTAFQVCEENLVAQSNQLDSVLLDFEGALLELSLG